MSRGAALSDGVPAKGDAAVRHGPDAITLLRDPATIRARCAPITRAVEAGASPYFKIDRGRLGHAAQIVERVTRAAYPDLRIPYHSRWRHFDAGGVPRTAEFDALLAGRSAAEQARARIDLATVSVLLDAGAGPDWHYHEAQTGQSFARSEGLAVATLRAFIDGLFSATPDDPLRADAVQLQRQDPTALARALQATTDNPLLGLVGRAALLNRLGGALLGAAATTGAEARPGALYDTLTRSGAADAVGAGEVLRALLDTFAPIWVTGSVLHGVRLGDVWPHPWAGGESVVSGAHGTTAGWVPFHKLSQWLAYSLLEPFEWAGVRVTGIDALTALPEYRNGGLLIDSGVIVARDPMLLSRTLKAGDQAVVEWRALTVTLIDELAPLVRERLGVTAEQMPLACILQGGTWAAGRELAEAMRGGRPPLSIESDGTVF